MKLIPAVFTALTLVSAPAIADDSGRAPTDNSYRGCPDYRMEGDRVVEICDDKLADGDILSPTEFARGFGGALTSGGGGESQ